MFPSTSIEASLGRPVFTHEFRLNLTGLIAEFEGVIPQQTLRDVIDLLPAEKVIIVEAQE